MSNHGGSGLIAGAFDPQNQSGSADGWHEKILNVLAAAIEIIRSLRAQGHQALLVGGCVRDLILGREPDDYDVATDATPERVMTLFPQSLPVGAQFGVVLVPVDGGRAVEVATFRNDGIYSDGRHPDQVSFSSS